MRFQEATFLLSIGNFKERVVLRLFSSVQNSFFPHSSAPLPSLVVTSVLMVRPFVGSRFVPIRPTLTPPAPGLLKTRLKSQYTLHTFQRRPEPPGSPLETWRMWSKAQYFRRAALTGLHTGKRNPKYISTGHQER